MSTNPVNVSSVFSNGDSIAGFAKHHLMPTAVMNQFNWSYGDSLLNNRLSSSVFALSRNIAKLSKILHSIA